MKDEINNNIKADKKARAKRADLEAMQERFDAIIKIADSDMHVDNSVSLIRKIAEGKTLEELTIEAGRAALGLE